MIVYMYSLFMDISVQSLAYKAERTKIRSPGLADLIYGSIRLAARGGATRCPPEPPQKTPTVHRTRLNAKCLKSKVVVYSSAVAHETQETSDESRDTTTEAETRAW